MVLKFEEYICEKYDFKEIETDNPENRVEYKFVNKDGLTFVVHFYRRGFVGEDDRGWIREYFIEKNGKNFSEINTGDSIGILKTVTQATVDFINKYQPINIKIEHLNTKKEGQEIRHGGKKLDLSKPNKRAIINRRFLERDLPPNYKYTPMGVETLIEKI